MSDVVVRVVGAATGRSTPHDGRYVCAWDPHTQAGTLALVSSDDKRMARRFPDARMAMEEWRTISQVQAFRPWDGEPNRPLSGLTISIESAE